jgi:pSer/pThr/pTyr-binding forkhead associated (FHA) protein
VEAIMSGQAVAQLFIKASDGAERVVSICDGETMTIGRSEDNTISLNDAGASRSHAVFTASRNGLVFIDRGSMNGSFVNGEQVLSMRNLLSGDLVDIGGTKISIELCADVLMDQDKKNSSRAMTARLKPLSVSILVASVSNLTHYESTNTPAEIDHLLKAWSQSVRSTVARCGGTIDKDCGHVIVALWIGNDPDAGAYAAVQAAISLRPAQQTTAVGVNTCCVVNSGSGLSGEFGDGQGGIKTFAVLGEPINTAFRLQDIVSKLGTDIVIPEGTAEMISGRVALQKIVRVKPERNSEAIDIYTVS